MATANYPVYVSVYVCKYVMCQHVIDLSQLVDSFQEQM